MLETNVDLTPITHLLPKLLRRWPSLAGLWWVCAQLSVASRMQTLPRTLRLILLLLPVALVVFIFLDTIIFMYRWFDKLIVPDAYHWLLLFISFTPLMYFEFRPSIGQKLYLISVAAVLVFVLMALIGAYFS